MGYDVAGDVVIVGVGVNEDELAVREEEQAIGEHGWTLGEIGVGFVGDAEGGWKMGRGHLMPGKSSHGGGWLMRLSL